MREWIGPGRGYLAGTTGLLVGLREGMTVIDCSTSIPASTQQVAATLAQRKVQF